MIALALIPYHAHRNRVRLGGRNNSRERCRKWGESITQRNGSLSSYERIWREEGLKVPQKQKKRRGLWLNNGSCIRLRAECPNHVWNYDFVEDRLRNGKKLRFLNIIDAYTRECLASIPRRSWRHQPVIEVLSGLFVLSRDPFDTREPNQYR